MLKIKTDNRSALDELVGLGYLAKSITIWYIKARESVILMSEEP